MSAENTIAKILQAYAIVNAVGGAILACMSGALVTGIILFFAVLVVSFLIYALGEIIELLHQIKKNTANTSVPLPTPSEEDLPEI